MKLMRLYMIVTLLLIATACNSSTGGGNTPTPTQGGDSSTTETPTATAVLNETEIPPTVTATEGNGDSPMAPSVDVMAGETLLDIPWDDGALFTAGLIEAEADVFTTLSGATMYQLAVTVHDDLTHLNGQEMVLYTNREGVALNEIYFRLFPNLLGGRANIGEVRVNDSPVEPVYTLQDSAMQLPLAKSLEPGEQVVIQLTFEVEVPPTSDENYGSFAYTEDVLALAHFYPMVAVYDDEGWNMEIPPRYGDVVYADTSFYVVRLTTPADQVVAGSGVVIDHETDDTTQTLTYAAGPMRDFYLVMSNRFAVMRETVGETTINSYVLPAVADENRTLLDNAVFAFNTFNERVGTYPFTELDIVSTPTTAGGIEYPGVVVVAWRLYENPTQFFETATVHEVGHQWFYSVVGNDQVDEPWLDESLTQYITWLYFGDRYGNAGASGFEQGMYGYWDRADRAETPLGLGVADYNEGSYGAIIYGRGPIFFHTLHQTIGDEAFDTFLHDYFAGNKWGIATTEILQSTAESACACELDDLFEDWVFDN